MMVITSCLGCSTEYFLLVPVLTGLTILSPVWCQHCNKNEGEPRINISSSPPSNKLSIGTAFNLTCIAWQTDDPKTKPYKVEWYNPQKKSINEDQLQCQAPGSSPMRCTLMVDALTNKTLGKYTCRARNYDQHCRSKQIQIIPRDTRSLEFINVPVNQTAPLGSNMTFTCTATGYPKPTIAWEKVNDSGSVQRNLTAKILTRNDNSIFSQLVITEVKRKDYGIYRCVAKNSVGDNISIAQFLSRDEIKEYTPAAPSVERKEGPSTATKKKNGEIIAISVTLSVAIMFLAAASVLCFRGRRPRDQCIHGDVAARNVFIDINNKLAKLGDFGLARDISDRGIYNKTSNGRVPWRWLSIESLRYRVYTSQSDVWSFGIFLWEIATFGEVPYPDIATPWALQSFLSSGRRMPRPDHCTEELCALMQSCWMENPLMRPTFQDITKRIRYFLRKVKKSYMNVQDDDITDDSETF